MKAMFGLYIYVVVFNESKIEGKHFSLLILKVGGYGTNEFFALKERWLASKLSNHSVRGKMIGQLAIQS